MFKSSRNTRVDLRRRKSLIDLRNVNNESLLFITAILMVLIISILCVAAAPNSNMLAGV